MPQLDIGNFREVRKQIEALDFDVLVNCAAQTNVDRCETHVEEAFRLNSTAVAMLADLATRKGARCVHISTDYVFEGSKTEPYTEEDEALPISVYGASKLGWRAEPPFGLRRASGGAGFLGVRAGPAQLCGSSIAARAGAGERRGHR